MVYSASLVGYLQRYFRIYLWVLYGPDSIDKIIAEKDLGRVCRRLHLYADICLYCTPVECFILFIDRPTD